MNFSFAQIGLEDYLWRYIGVYNKLDLDDICGVDAKYQYDPSTHGLQIITSRGKPVAKARQRMEQLIQNLRRNIYDKKCQMRHDIDVDTFQSIANSVVDNEHSHTLFYIEPNEQVYHVVGPRDLVQMYYDQIQQQFLCNGHVDEVLHFFTPGSICVEVFQNDLLLERVDAIVNPANVRLDHGGGAARAIADAAGKKLRQECRQYIKSNGKLRFTEVMHTTAGDLNPRILFVMHAAGPPAEEFPDQKKLQVAMFETFRNCLSYANDKLNVRSMSLPAIGAGM